MSAGLAERLRAETRGLHAQAERSGVMAALLAGRLARDAYCALLRNLHDLYTALEAALARHREDARVASIHDPALARREALAADLAVLHPGAWQQAFPQEPATQAYVARLNELSASGAPALVAHAYVRYLGDLHGGQLLAQRVAGSYALQDGAGTRFYDFGPAGEVAARQQAFRAGLSAMPVSAVETDAIVAEACWAFGMHQRLFEQLDARYPPRRAGD